ncbi:MAG: penicillin-binding protein 2 [Chloroflexota bacterium]|nr:penicillin-binding protein 2 [Chloroflexota bacterium]
MRTILSALSAIAAFAIIAIGLGLRGEISDGRWLAVLAISWLLLLLASRIPLAGSMPAFNRSLIRTALVLATVFIVISAQLVRIQVVRSDDTFYRTAEAPNGEIIGNPRIGNAELAVDRGDIVDRNGAIIAQSEREGDVYVRTYPDPSTAYVAGYYSPLLFGASGIEAAANAELTGRQGNNPVTRSMNSLLNRPQQGMTVGLTLDAELQANAQAMLGDSRGSVVVMDVKTGEVMVLASAPAYDPNQLFTASTADNDGATAYWERLGASPDAPLVQRSTQGRYIPGSTFKTVTAAIGIEAGYIEPDDLYEDNGEITIDGRVLVENNRPDDTRDQWTVAEGLAWSLNVVFAQMGLEIGATDFWDYSRDFGFGAPIPFDLPVAQSQIAGSREFLSDDNALADTAFGQGELLASPLHMAMITSVYVNGGQMAQPYLVDRVIDQDRDIISRTEPRIWRQSVSAETAADVETMMVGAVTNGSVSGAAADGYRIGGKTGTAETGGGSAHSWFIGFIGNDEPRYAVAVILEEGGGGLSDAVAIGRDILVATMESNRESPSR